MGWSEHVHAKELVVVYQHILVTFSHEYKMSYHKRVDKELKTHLILQFLCASQIHGVKIEWLKLLKLKGFMQRRKRERS